MHFQGENHAVNKALHGTHGLQNLDPNCSWRIKQNSPL